MVSTDLTPLLPGKETKALRKAGPTQGHKWESLTELGCHLQASLLPLPARLRCAEGNSGPSEVLYPTPKQDYSLPKGLDSWQWKMSSAVLFICEDVQCCVIYL